MLATIKSEAQNKLTTSDQVTISGKVKTEMTFTISELDKLTKTNVGDVTFMEGKEVKYTGHDIKGISLKQLFEKISFDNETHKALNKFYFVLEAPDGYKVVFSYNEIFSPITCNNFFLVTDYDGKNITVMGDRILVISCNDAKQGHKSVKGLNKIIVKEAD